MALNTFIKIDGIKGESQDAKHKDEIDVLSWSWALEQSAAIPPGGGGAAGKVSSCPKAFAFSLMGVTPTLLSMCAGY